MPLTIGEALVVARAANVATVTNAMADIKKITSIIPVSGGVEGPMTTSMEEQATRAGLLEEVTGPCLPVQRPVGVI